MSLSTARDIMKAAGWTVGTTERRLPRGRTTVDLFGCIDLVAVRVGSSGVAGIQATSPSNVSSRCAKIMRFADLALHEQPGPDVSKLGAAEAVKAERSRARDIECGHAVVAWLAAGNPLLVLGTTTPKGVLVVRRLILATKEGRFHGVRISEAEDLSAIVGRVHT